MKKLTLSLVAAGLAASSLGAYAAVPTGAAPFQVVVPNLKSGIELTLEGMYLQPTNSDLVYSNASTFPSNTVTNTQTSSVKPNYDLGFRVGFGYIFPDSGNDVQVSWTHFDHNSTDSYTYIPEPVFSSGVTKTNSGDASFKYDAVDLDMGQYLSIGTRLQTRVFVGVRGAQLKSDMTGTFAYPSATPTPGVSVRNSKFTGIGPRMGIDTSYHVGDCFGIVSHFATALLVGNVDNSQVFTSEGQGGNITNNTTDTQTRVVPAFDAKLGVDYSIPFKNNASSLSIEGGYQVTQYVDVQDRITDGVTKTSSIGFNGPYLSLNFKV